MGAFIYELIHARLCATISAEYHKNTVKILVFGVYENPLLLREVHTLGRTMLIMFLDRRNSENS